MNAYKTVSFVGIVILLFGIGIAGYGFSFLLKQNELEKNGIEVKGKVIAIAKKAIYRAPIVEFKTRKKKKIRFKSELELNVDFFSYTVGQEIDVIYDPKNPKKAKINAFWESNFEQIFLGSFGVLLMILGLFLRWAFLRKARKQAE